MINIYDKPPFWLTSPEDIKYWRKEQSYQGRMREARKVYERNNTATVRIHSKHKESETIQVVRESLSHELH